MKGEQQRLEALGYTFDSVSHAHEPGRPAFTAVAVHHQGEYLGNRAGKPASRALMEAVKLAQEHEQGRQAGT